MDINSIYRSLERTRKKLIGTQNQDGSWSSGVRSDVRSTCFVLSALKRLEVPRCADTDLMEAHLCQELCNNEGWEVWPGSGPDVEVTLVAVVALLDARTEKGKTARDLAADWLARQAPPIMDSFWLGYLALNRCISWREVPHLPTWLVAGPKWLRPNIWDLSFLRLAAVATCIIQSSATGKIQEVKKQDSSPAGNHFNRWFDCWIEREMSTNRWIHSFTNRAARATELFGDQNERRMRAIEWLLQHQEEDGSFFCSVHMTTIAIVALHSVDAKTYHMQVNRGLVALKAWQKRQTSGIEQQFTDSTTWDTILNLSLLSYLKPAPKTHSVQKAKRFLLEKQNFWMGDWSKRVKKPKGGSWGFQRVGKWYPDCDDTAFALAALVDVGDEDDSLAIHDGIEWLMSMQCKNGGWASWDRNDRWWIMIPRAGRWFARDLAAVDITARAVAFLAKAIRNKPQLLMEKREEVLGTLKSGVSFLEAHGADGVWFGSWFTHFIYGTSLVAEAIVELDLAKVDHSLECNLEWLRACANSDGGYGESPRSALRKEFVAAPSTPFHTASALIALVSVGSGSSFQAHRAAEWLIENQNSDGSWTNHDFFAAGVPGLWYANFESTPTYFAAKSLKMYADQGCGAAATEFEKLGIRNGKR